MNKIPIYTQDMHSQVLYYANCMCDIQNSCWKILHKQLKDKMTCKQKDSLL